MKSLIGGFLILQFFIFVSSSSANPPPPKELPSCENEINAILKDMGKPSLNSDKYKFFFSGDNTKYNRSAVLERTKQNKREYETGVRIFNTSCKTNPTSASCEETSIHLNQLLRNGISMCLNEVPDDECRKKAVVAMDSKTIYIPTSLGGNPLSLKMSVEQCKMYSFTKEQCDAFTKVKTYGACKGGGFIPSAGGVSPPPLVVNIFEGQHCS